MNKKEMLRPEIDMIQNEKYKIKSPIIVEEW